MSYVSYISISLDHLKLAEIAWNKLFFGFKNFEFFWKWKMESPNYKNENIERKYLNTMGKNQFLKLKNSLLELEEHFIELKDKELKGREIKIKREIEKLFFKLIIVSIDDMDEHKFEEKEMKKIMSIKNTWYDWLINYIPDPVRKNVGGFKDKIVSFFKTNTSKHLNKLCKGEERN